MTSEIHYAGATEIADLVRTRTVSPVEVMRAHLGRTEAVNWAIKAVVTVDERAMARAREAESATMRGESWGPLHGVPFTAKEVFDTRGLRTTRGSTVFADNVPEADATAVRRLKAAGGVLMGKTNCPEFALSAETSNNIFGRTSNPWDLERTAGGSSGGEAAAISAGLSPLGIGTDLGGSNRLPSHYCGVVGFKPTHGRVPLTGSWPELMPRHMHVGPIARTVRDASLALAVLSGPDGADPYALNMPAPTIPGFDDALPPLRVGWFPDGPFAPVDHEVQDAVRNAATALESLGCVLEHVSPDLADRMPISVAMVLLLVEAGHYLPAFVAGREGELSPSIAGLLDSATPTLAEYLAALDRREALAREIAGLFASYDLLLCPTAPVTAPGHDEDPLTVNGTEAGPAHVASITVTFGLTGQPAISVPFEMSDDGMPIGVQLVAGHLKDETLLHAAHALEAVSGVGTLHPPL